MPCISLPSIHAPLHHLLAFSRVDTTGAGVCVCLRVFVLMQEDITDVKPKMILTLLASMMHRAKEMAAGE